MPLGPRISRIRGLGTEAQTDVDGDAVIIEQDGVDVRHIAAVLPADDAA